MSSIFYFISGDYIYIYAHIHEDIFFLQGVNTKQEVKTCIKAG